MHKKPNRWELKQKQSRIYGMKRGKPRSFKLPEEWDEIIDKRVGTSGMTFSDYIAELIGEELDLF